MKKKDAKKFSIRKNKRGYWEKGGGCESELLVATICLGCAVILIGIQIIMSVFAGA